MSKLCLLLAVVALLVVASGCASEPSGNRQYIPGKGWVPND
jgi:hypothetical protein